MVRRSPLLSLAGLLLSLPNAASTPAQTAQTAPPRITGTVRNSVTGEPVGHALVASLDNRLATLTDDEGHFTFDLAPAPPPGGQSADPAGRPQTAFGPGAFLQLRSQKPGFLGEDLAFVSLSAASSGPVPASPFPAQPADNVELRLTPAAIITGTVSSDTTDDAANVQVILLRHQVQDGERTWIQLNTQTTTSRGAFRFANLEPGEYTIMTAEWRGDRPLPAEPNATTQQYPPVFLGDTPGLTSTGILHLQPGETAPADLHLRPATYFAVTVPVAGSAGYVNVQVSTPDELSQFTLGFNSREHAVTGALPNGDYALLLTGAPDTSGPQIAASFANLPLHIAGAPVHTAPVALTSSGSTAVRVRKEFTRDHPDSNFNVNLTLRPETANRGFAGGNNQPGNLEEFSLQNVHPGRYRVNVQSFPGYVSAATSGSTDLLREPLVVGPSGTAEAIHVTVRDDPATLTGTVASAADGRASARTWLLLVPTGGAGQMAESLAGPDHTFAFSNVVPGAYRLLAFTGRLRPPQIAWREPDALRAFDGQGVAFTAEPGETLHKDVTVTDAPTGER